MEFETSEKIFASWWIRSLAFIAIATILSIGFYIIDAVTFGTNLTFKIGFGSDLLRLIGLVIDLMLMLCFLALSYLIDIFRVGSKPFSFGLLITPNTKKDIKIGELICLVGFSAVILISLIFSNKITFGFQVGFVSFILTTFYILIGAILEELIFRGIVFQALLDRFGVGKAIFISSIVFAIGHFLNPNLSTIGFVNIIIGGVLLSVMFIRTRSLWLVISFHFTWNWLQAFIMGSPVSGNNFGISLISLDFYNLPSWLFGGAFGIEGGILSTCILITSVWFVISKTEVSPFVSALNYKRKYFESIIQAKKII